jgi:hypothetical protein
MTTRLAPLELPGDEYRWWREVALAFDCFANALLAGWHHETLSSRAWRAWSNGKVFGRISKPAIDVMFVWQTRALDHCKRVFLRDLDRARRVVKEKNL